VPDDSLNSGPGVRPGGATLIAAGILLATLAVVVLYTSRRAFLSPLSLVVVAAIGVAALLLQLRLRPDLSASLVHDSSVRSSLWINALGVIFAIGAVLGDFLRLKAALLLIAALAAVVCFAASGIVVLSAMRKRRKQDINSASSKV
jgi:predicted MFS family arabinose efflux permease